MVKGYDKIDLNYGVLLDLPFNEGSGIITRDIAKPHHQEVSLVGPPAWGKVALSNTNVLVLNGATDYLECPAIDTVDLDFTSEDYSIGVWINWTSLGGVTSSYIIGRGAVENDGWDTYLNLSGGLNTLSQRHAHVSGGGGNLKSECFSTGWTPGIWWFFGMSRSGLYTPHYRNGVALTMSYSAFNMEDPDTAVRDLVIGSRYTKDQHWFLGMMKRPRIWGRALAAEEWQYLFEMERHLFGV